MATCRKCALLQSPVAYTPVPGVVQTSILKQVEDLLVLEKKDPARPDAVQSVRSATNKWVAKYRRGAQQGKPSFGCAPSIPFP